MTILLWLIKNTKTEIKIVLATLAVLIFLPIVSVVVVASSGVQLVGDALAALNPITHLVEIFDTEGNVIGEVELTTNWPTRGYISDEFGSEQQFRLDWGLGAHTGIDIANQNGLIGEPVTPFMTGTVLFVDQVDDSACGINVKLQHDFNITSTYCHLSSAVNIAPTTEVHPGDIIGYMGSTGASTGPHLHLTTAVYGIPINPRTFLVGEPEGSTVVVPTF
ncbi:M23 family metallopeptidase [Candidatus Saccharibacteria bacterium]|nr:M23 family metallopeptidase [Candidatus Saccharibacteria bacterium]